MPRETVNRIGVLLRVEINWRRWQADNNFQRC